MIHAFNKAEADFIGEQVSSKLGHKIGFSQALFSTLVLKNLPASVSEKAVRQAFGRHQVKNVRIFGGRTLSVAVEGAENALKASQAIQNLATADESVKLSVSVQPFLGEKNYVLTVSNVGTTENISQLQERIQSTLRELFKGATMNVRINGSGEGTASALLRFSPTLSEASRKSIVEKVSKITADQFGGISVSGVSDFKNVPRPCLFFRKVFPSSRYLVV
jgi:2'-5' RNA ligase